jgi:hypothetical protein
VSERQPDASGRGKGADARSAARARREVLNEARRKIERYGLTERPADDLAAAAEHLLRAFEGEPTDLAAPIAGLREALMRYRRSRAL